MEIEFVRYGDSKVSVGSIVWRGTGEVDYTVRPVALVVDSGGRDAAVYLDDTWHDAATTYSRDWMDSSAEAPPSEIGQRIDDALNLR